MTTKKISFNNIKKLILNESDSSASVANYTPKIEVDLLEDRRIVEILDRKGERQVSIWQYDTSNFLHKDNKPLEIRSYSFRGDIEDAEYFIKELQTAVEYAKNMKPLQSTDD